MRRRAKRAGICSLNVSQLPQTLRKLQRDGIVARSVYPVVPAHVEHALTPVGITLIDALGALCKWAEENLSAVEAARNQFDRPGLP